MSKKIVYLGPTKSYSELAASSFANKGDILISSPSFLDVLDAVKNGEADLAVVPVENSIEGIVNEVTDGLIFTMGESGIAANLYINFEFYVTINNYLISKKGCDFSKIKTVVSHWQPYGQCRHTLKRFLPNARIIYADSTSNALAGIKDKTVASIGGLQLVEGDLIASDVCINDAPNNITRFVVLSKDNVICDKNSKITIAFEVQNKPGGLIEVLSILRDFDLNMTRLESRPHKSALGRYVFIADIVGNVKDIKIAEALKKIEDSTSFYKYLGGYSKL